MADQKKGSHIGKGTWLLAFFLLDYWRLRCGWHMAGGDETAGRNTGKWLQLKTAQYI
jgi:hypothetical protein